MAIHFASLTKRIKANGQALHRAMARRMEAGGKEPSEAEAALVEERRTLKEEQKKRKERALLPRPTALQRLVRTHHPEAKEKPKAKKADGDHADVKKPKAKRSRAEKHAEQMAAQEAARHTKQQPKKPATK